jgi:hypothetical protein
VLTHPHLGQRVRLRYRPTARPFAQHGQAGEVVIVGTSKPRNHGVRLADGTLVVVPAGNLVPAEDRWRPNPCGCRGCNVCGWYGLAPKPVVTPVETMPALPEPPRRAEKAVAPGLFDAIATE